MGWAKRRRVLMTARILCQVRPSGVPDRLDASLVYGSSCANVMSRCEHCGGALDPSGSCPACNRVPPLRPEWVIAAVAGLSVAVAVAGTLGYLDTRSAQPTIPLAPLPSAPVASASAAQSAVEVVVDHRDGAASASIALPVESEQPRPGPFLD